MRNSGTSSARQSGLKSSHQGKIPLVSDGMVMKVHEQYLTEVNEWVLRERKRTGKPVSKSSKKNMDEVLDDKWRRQFRRQGAGPA